MILLKIMFRQLHLILNVGLKKNEFKLYEENSSANIFYSYEYIIAEETEPPSKRTLYFNHFCVINITFNFVEHRFYPHKSITFLWLCLMCWYLKTRLSDNLL